MGPRRNVRRKTVGPGGISVSVSGNIDALRPRLIDFRHHVRHAPPVPYASDLKVPHFDWNFGFASNSDSFFQCGQNSAALVSNMGGVNPAKPGRFAGE